MSTVSCCARCGDEVEADDTVFVIVMIMLTRGLVDLPDMSADELRDEIEQLLAQLNQTSKADADEEVHASHVSHLCARCLDSWDWTRLRGADQDCAKCGDSTVGDENTYRAGFAIVRESTERTRLAKDDLQRIEAAKNALTRRMQGLPDPDNVVGSDDLVVFALCSGCKPDWLIDPFDERDWPGP